MDPMELLTKAPSHPKGKDTSPNKDIIDFYAGLPSATVKDVGPAIANGNQGDRVGSFTAIGSSELIDRAGDNMERSALNDMKLLNPSSVELGGTPSLYICFMNHDYYLPFAVQGGITSVTTDFTEKLDEELQAIRSIAVVKVEVEVSHNPAAIQNFLYMVQENLRIGVSIGCQILDFDFRMDQDGYVVGLIIKRISPIEFSTCGVPCNREAWVTDATKGLFKKHAGLNLAKTAPLELAKMAKDWRSFEGLDSLMLRRVSKAVSIVRQEFNPDVLRSYRKDLDEDDIKFLGVIAEGLEPYGLGITTLATLAAETTNAKQYTVS